MFDVRAFARSNFYPCLHQADHLIPHARTTSNANAFRRRQHSANDRMQKCIKFKLRFRPKLCQVEIAFDNNRPVDLELMRQALAPVVREALAPLYASQRERAVDHGTVTAHDAGGVGETRQ